MVAYPLAFLQNFVLIFSSIVLFMLPFVAVFAIRNREQIFATRPRFNYFMERFFLSPESNALILVWAACEAIWWFIIPEFLLFLLIFMKIHRKFDLVKYDLIGTVIGTVIVFCWRLPNDVFEHLPYVRPKMLEHVHGWYDQLGIWGLVHQPFSGVPYKVFTHEAVDYHFFIPLFILVAVVARMVRYLVVYEATKALYPLLHKFVRRHYAILFVVACLVFTGLLVRVVRIYS
jgi:membrane protein YqaA with SNARE-associated domain